jgi:5'-nucleotidase
MRILLSNDDGVESDGLQALALALLPLGEVVVCAPDREQSATSHSISLHRPVRIDAVAPWGPNGEIRRFAVDGTPTDAVYVGVHHVLRDAPPDLVASGINRGANVAQDVHYSGTVAAAMEACVLGLPAFAISLVGRTAPRDWSHAAAFAPHLAREIARRRLPSGTLLNVNVPPGVPQGVRITRTGWRSFAAAVVQKMDPRGRAYYWIGGDEQEHEDVPGSDCNAVFDERCISVTPLHLDLTQVALVRELATWSLPGQSAQEAAGGEPPPSR